MACQCAVLAGDRRDPHKEEENKSRLSCSWVTPRWTLTASLIPHSATLTAEVNFCHRTGRYCLPLSHTHRWTIALPYLPSLSLSLSPSEAQSNSTHKSSPQPLRAILSKLPTPPLPWKKNVLYYGFKTVIISAPCNSKSLGFIRANRKLQQLARYRHAGHE